MAVLFFDSFDYYTSTSGNGGLSAGGWQNTGTAIIVSAGRFGSNNLRLGAGSNAKRTLASSVAKATVAGAANLLSITAGTGQMFMAISSSTAFLVNLWMDGTGKLVVNNSSSSATAGTIYCSSSSAVFTGSGGIWHYVEATLDTAAGTISVYVDGNLVCSASGITFAASISNYQLYASSAGGTIDWDDHYVTDGDRLGPCRCVTLAPAADTAQANSTPSTGTARHSCVDDIPSNGDTDYVSDSTVNDSDLYTINALPVGSLVEAMQTILMSRIDDATPHNIESVIQSGGVAASGSAYTNTSNYGVKRDIFLTDPATGSAWTEAGIDNLEIGWKILS